MTATDATSVAPGKWDWLRHPPGLWVLALTEAWERFSYYGMKGLLVVYLATQVFRDRPTADGEATASSIFGWYTGLIYFTPLVGGMISDRWLGRRASVVTGGLIMAAGHFLVAFERLTLIGLALIVIGNGLFLPTLGSQVSSLYAQDDPRRGSAFNIYYLGINVGAFLAPLVIGTLGTTVGWHWGFGAAGVGMVIGLLTYVFGRKWLPPEPPRGAALAEARARTPSLGKVTGGLIGTLLAVWAAVVVFRVAYLQQGNSLARFADASVDRSTPWGDFPFPWFDSVNAGVVLLGTPVLVWMWTRQAGRGREWSPLIKMSFGALLTGLSFLMLGGAAAATPTGGLVHWLWLFAFFVSMTLGELCILPVGLGLFGRLAPDSARATMIAVWFSAAFAGGVLSGYVGALYQTLGPALFFTAMAGVCALSAAFLFLLDRPARVVEAGAQADLPAVRQDP